MDLQYINLAGDTYSIDLSPSGIYKPEEVLEETITENGDYSYTPTEGSVFSSANISVDVHPEDSLVETITTNGTHNFTGEWTNATITVDADIPSVTEPLTVNSNGTYTPEAGVDGFNEVTVDVQPLLQTKTVSPSTSSQTVSPDSGYDGLSSVSLGAVDSSIDSNITSGNIRTGVTILGVTGDMEERKPEETETITPTNLTRSIVPTAGSVFSAITVEGYDVDEIYDELEDINTGNVKQSYSYFDGHVDEEGLEDIGWDEESIGMYRDNERHYSWQDSEYTVSDANKALYDVVNYNNITGYKTDPNFVYCPYFDIPSNITSMYNWFRDFKNLRGIPILDTSNITNMSGMLYGNAKLQSIPQLDTSSVTSMNSMFNGCSALQSIPQLDTSSVTDMGGMFSSCSALTSIPELDTSSVTNMSHMFLACYSLTYIPQLNTSNVTDMGGMFENCNNSLTSIPELDTSSVTNMKQMFYNCKLLTSIPQLNTSSVTNMQEMFYECRSLTSIPEIDTHSVTNMKEVFSGCASLQYVGGVDFSGLTSELKNLFGYTSSMPNLTHFIVNGVLNVSISDNYSIKTLTKIDYESVRSILLAASRTTNSNAKTLAFNRTMTDQEGELAGLVSTCQSKGWTITGLTLN